MLAVIFIALAVAMVVGPLMLLRPSPKQKRETRLRQLAAKHGLRVKMRNNPAAGASDFKSVAAYGLTLNLSPKSPLSSVSWTLTRTKFAHEMHVADCWQWMNNELQAPIERDDLLKYLEALPESIVALEQAGKDLYVYWTEILLPGQGAEDAFLATHASLLNLSRLITPSSN